MSMGFPRQEYWSGLPFPPPGIFQTQGANPGLLPWQADSLPLLHQGNPRENYVTPKTTRVPEIAS